MTASSAQDYSPALRALLDQYDVPQLPEGFADRLVARAEANEDVEQAQYVPSSARRHNAGPWRRASRWIGSVATIGLMSATAAAMGILGEPIEVPVLSDIARSLEIVDVAKPEKQPLVKQSAPEEADSPGVDPIQDSAERTDGQINAEAMIQRITDAPRFKTLRPRQKAVLLRAATRRLVQSGKATPQDIQAAVTGLREERRAERQATNRRENIREKIRNATPEQQDKLQERIDSLPPQRKAIAQERLDKLLSDVPPTANALPVSEDSKASVTEGQNEAVPDVTVDENLEIPDTSADAPVAPAPIALPALEHARQRYQQATPAERARMRQRAKKLRKTIKTERNIRNLRAQIRRNRRN
ncbi:MAG: hypothetical protein ABJO01_16235 [Parasphingorhabdus sp.]|uniref:hypothetical protein n=1 Tax=Parasphingorhabdus sp. TaxID=2709688 RepID=UPI00329939EB